MTTPPITLGSLIDLVAGSADEPLEQLGRAVARAGDLSTLGDQLVGHFVDVARASGASWAQIGQRLGGISKQAAQQRFSTPADFSRFTERAKAVMRGAQSAAEQHQHSYIGTEHLLLALCADPDALSAKALAALAGPLDRVRAAVEEAFAGPSPVQAKPRWTQGAKLALARALNEALDLGHNYIGTEHLLLGIAKGAGDDRSLGQQILDGLGTDYAAIRESLITQLSGHQPKNSQ